MRHGDVIFGCTETKRIKIDQKEAAARLHTARGYTNELMEDCGRRLAQALQYRYAYVQLPLSFPAENCCDLGFAVTESRDLYRNLQGCSRIFVFGVTAGIQVDRLLMRLSALSSGEHFITDGLSSAAAESYCEYLAQKLGEQGPCKPRFSPGYGDLALSLQVPLLQRLDARETLGITLSDSLLMTPAKSITAIMGVRDE